ncbi:hypothetical protein MNBD_ACTINO02-1663 [hydrothermal vent metagenome]|uniref:DUF1684 domain-containing protein n=1 Tax=hydrothermal vent metagenome TaxID=652676 RepID=A0A3B0TKL9_9ZZZZ
MSVTLQVMTSFIALADYRRRVHEMYASVRNSQDPAGARDEWVAARAALFRDHSQTPLDPAESFTGLNYAPYDPSWRFVVPVRTAPALDLLIPHSASGQTRFRRIGNVVLPVVSRPTLDVFWLDAYGGGIFIPFRDATNGIDTYGGGRYLLDSVKGADLGSNDDGLVLDFNFAYHPSCTYSPRWSCPLAPQGNVLALPVPAGEQLPWRR